MSTPDHNTKLESSRFFQRLTAASGPDVSSLETTVRMVCSKVASVTTTVREHFHAYTLHDMTHLWNVVDIMEELVPEDVWKKPWNNATDPLGPFQCALCLMAGLVHDLGMAPPNRLIDKLKDAENLDGPIPNDADQDFVAYRRHFASCEDDVRAIKSLLDKENVTPDDFAEVERRRQMIRTEYLRLTHSDDTISGCSRIRDWLLRWQPEDKWSYDNWPYLNLLVNVAMSHAHSSGLKWLERELGESIIEDMGSEQACGLHAALLLRLADILDLDASRAPAVLYRNFPPDNKVSEQHWQQHLCISRRVIDWKADPPTVTFRKSTHPCRNPEIANALANYCGWIRDEVRSVEDSQSRHKLEASSEFPIRLPGSGLDEEGRPRSIRLDPSFRIEGGWSSEPVRFELSQQDVVKILMGEELYGEPELCLREVIQNALDATHLRWLRSQLRQRMVKKLGEAAYAKYDLPPADPVPLKQDDLEIKVSWGVDNLPDDGWRRDDDDRAADERHWIEIEDPGTGMTLDVVKKYFTQIGKSYYQSPEYRRDRALFREYDLPASEISQFGIGILSCFMLADMVEVWTKPIPSLVPTEDDYRAYHYRIWGADGLFRYQPIDEKTSPGTVIRMWLKKDRTAGCCPQDLQRHLFVEHYGRPKDRMDLPKPAHVDPLRTIWARTPWPRYSIRFNDRHSPNDFSHWAITPSSNLERLLPLAPEPCLIRLSEVTQEPTQDSFELHWAWWDWEHQPTASRIRVALPVSSRSRKGATDSLANLLNWVNSGCALEEVSAGLVMPFIADATITKESRTRVLIRGAWIRGFTSALDLVRIFAYAGAVIVIDLSGHAAPRLRADRMAVTEHQRDDWAAEVDNVFEDWLAEATNSVGKNPALARIAATSILLTRGTWYELTGTTAETGLIRFPTIASSRLRAPVTSILKWDINHGEDFSIGKNEDHSLAASLTFAIDPTLAFAPARMRDPTLGIAVDIALQRTIEAREETFYDSVFDRLFDISHYSRSRGLRQLLSFTNKQWSQLSRCFQRFCRDANLPEVFGDSLMNSLPVFQCPIAEGRGSDGRMISPWQLEFRVTRPNGDRSAVTTRFDDGWTGQMKWLDQIGYDLVAPWTHIPIGELRENCNIWMDSRGLRIIHIIPFLFSGSLKWRGFRSDYKRFSETFGIEQVTDILLLVPDESLDMVPFSEWKRAETEAHVVTAYWHLSEDQVLWAEGFHDRNSIRQHGRTLEQHAGIEPAS